MPEPDTWSSGPEAGDGTLSRSGAPRPIGRSAAPGAPAQQAGAAATEAPTDTEAAAANSTTAPEADAARPTAVPSSTNLGAAATEAAVAAATRTPEAAGAAQALPTAAQVADLAGAGTQRRSDGHRSAEVGVAGPERHADPPAHQAVGDRPLRGSTGGDGGDKRSRPRHRRRRWVVAVVVVAAAATTTVTALRLRSGDNDGSSTDDTATTTAPVETRDLVITEAYEGQLGFGSAESVAAGRAGVVTDVASVGSTVTSGDVLFDVDLQPTVLLAGTVPVFRDLSTDADPGADIAQLEHALVNLGYGAELTVDEEYTSETVEAVEAWEEALGRFDPDGVVQRGEIVFATGDLRIDSVTADVGTQVDTDAAVVEATATAHVVTLDLPVDDASRLEPGTPVQIELPDGTATSGTVAEVGTASDSTDDSTSQTGTAVPSADPAAEPTLPVTITLDDPAAAAAFDSGTVDVRLERSRVDGAVAVPVTALLALAEGGYAVQVVDPSQPAGYVLVGVEVGTIADEYAEISGDGIEPGVEVVVPA